MRFEESEAQRHDFARCAFASKREYEPEWNQQTCKPVSVYFLPHTANFTFHLLLSLDTRDFGQGLELTQLVKMSCRDILLPMWRTGFNW